MVQSATEKLVHGTNPNVMKDDATKESQVLGKVQSAGLPERIVISGFRELCNLISLPSGSGKLPYGIILGYLAQTGAAMCRFQHRDISGQGVDYVLPKGNRTGTCALTDMMGIGVPLQQPSKA